MKKREYTVPNSIPSRKWKKKYPCRKGKGEHAFELKYAVKYTFWYDEISVSYECSVCGKKRVEFIPSH